MEWMTANSMRMMEQSMRFLWTKQTSILDNIANVETPGYKTKYVTFEEALHSRLQAAAKDGKPQKSIREVLNGSVARVHEASDESARMDENGVNITEQATELVRNAYQLQFVMNSITSDMAMLRTAIRGQ